MSVLWAIAERRKEKMNEIVSVIVVSFNSSEFIEETLQSIYEQEYEKIELIIADDASTDDTQSIVENWEKKNASRFFAFKKAFSTQNHGVTQNMINGIEKSSGKWIKLIAADDMLLPNCIKDNIQFAEQNNIEIVFSDMHYFRVVQGEQSIQKMNNASLKSFCSLSCKDQKEWLYRENVLPAPAGFFSRALYDKVGGFDPEIKMMEDWPFWIRVCQHNVRINYMPQYTIKYRINENSVSHSKRFWVVQQQVKEKYIYPNIPKSDISYYYNEFLIRKKCELQDNVPIGCTKFKLIEVGYACLWWPYLAQLLRRLFVKS